MSEHSIQNQGRNALALPGVFCTRTNVGKGWTGDVHRLTNGDILIKNPRPFDTGLPNGFSDTFGVVCETVDGVARAVPFFIEYKQPGKNPTAIQAAFLAAMRRLGARAGVARSADEAVAIALGNVA